MRSGLDPEPVPPASLTLDPGTKTSAPKQSPPFPFHLKTRETKPQDSRSVEGNSNTQPSSKPFLGGGGELHTVEET